MSDPRYTFKRFEQRNDIGDIKSKCYDTSAQASDDKRRSMTTYRHDYIRYPINTQEIAKPPQGGIHIGGGNLSPTRDEMRTNYQNFFKKYDSYNIEKGKPIPNSCIFEDKYPIPESTQQAANNEVLGKTPKYDNETARRRTIENNGAHFVLGDDGRNFDTDYNANFKNYHKGKPDPIRNDYKKSSIQFDNVAGYGPHTRSMSKRPKYPEIADAEKPDHTKVNYDIGYSKTPYMTTNQAFATDPRYFKRVDPVKAPSCAELADHGRFAGKWGTTYRQDYDGRPKIPNEIDIEELKRSHWDQGHDENDWRRKKFATSPHKPKKEFMEMQKSNIVFKGDGSMSFNTTQNDLIGRFDPNEESRCMDDFTDARADHLFLGAEHGGYESTAKAMNRLAGTGSPAKMSDDLHKRKATAFAKGGTYDRYASKEDISEKRYKPVEQPKIVDGTYFRQSHFDLDATASNKPRYKTTYFETICRPKIHSINYEYA
ncbi:hypothetical protein TRFO_42787 [Tritrichomonas foetus]|uniref:Uncharacterized protein n=1 Tax=Tritrichomonas foetus TaxID=1144522 RepID=A0A1J4KVS3_9EUKA|nr:hypothetical protein TRFO_42787 [Tritrichomonas foetus]|eukprot:OHT14992.1 hypothetical protein TRFO_42787 [Tritrichomonas foetus]